ncbi:hypothetical protein TNCV_1534091 [Trichonephila clavipes]|nr:hypothetical protein TNCV_1534091 [Trichonephila clavipes]
MSTDYPKDRCKTKRDQSGPEKEDAKNPDPTINITDTSSSLHSRVVRSRNRIPGADDQAVRVIEAEETNNNSARKWEECLNINVALFSCTRAFGDGPRNFEPWSSDVDDT